MEKKNKEYIEKNHAVQENRERIIAIEVSLRSLDVGLREISKKMDQLIDKIDNVFATKEYVLSKTDSLQKDIDNSRNSIKPWTSGLSDLIKYILIAIIGAVLASVIKL